MKEVVINNEYGGFSLPNDKKLFIARAKHEEVYPYAIIRDVNNFTDIYINLNKIVNEDMQTFESATGFCKCLSLEMYDKEIIPEKIKEVSWDHENEPTDKEDMMDKFKENLIIIDENTIDRTDPDLIRSIKYFGGEGAMGLKTLQIIEIPDEDYYHIREYDGMEELVHGSLEKIQKELGIKK